MGRTPSFGSSRQTLLLLGCVPGPFILVTLIILRQSLLNCQAGFKLWSCLSFLAGVTGLPTRPGLLRQDVEQFQHHLMKSIIMLIFKAGMWCLPVILTLGGLRQKDCESILGHIVTSCLKEPKGKTKQNYIVALLVWKMIRWIHCSLSQSKLMRALNKRRLLIL